MAFDGTQFTPLGGNSRTGHAPVAWSYKTDVDTLADLEGANYFGPINKWVKEDEFIYAVATDGIKIYTINSVDTAAKTVTLDTDAFEVGAGVTDHTLLSNIGTNTHVQIDSHIADSTIHFTVGSLGLGNYLRHDGSNDITGQITPNADDTLNFGGQASKFRRLFSRSINAHEGSSSRGTQGNNGIISGRNYGPGTNTLSMGGGTYPPVGMFGNVFSYYASQTCTMRLDGGGSFMTGSAFAFYGANDTAEIICDASSFASFTGGYSYPYSGSSNMTIRIRNSAAGSFVWAYPAGNGNGRTHEVRCFNTGPGSFTCGRTRGIGDAFLHSQGAGSFNLGYINASNATATGRIRSQAAGAFSQGNVVASDAAGTAEIRGSGAGSFAQGTALNSGSILATNQGSFAQGRASSTGAIQATQRGSFAHGNQTGAGNIEATGQGAFAVGRCLSGYSITASGLGAFAVGESDTASIVASATNSVQFGPGTNSLADSLKVGTAGIRFKGTTGAPGTPVNGDFWIASGDINFRSNGVTVGPFNQPSVTGSRAGNAALASLLTQLATMNIITDSSTA